jgi:flagellar motor switch protein FliN
MDPISLDPMATRAPGLPSGAAPGDRPGTSPPAGLQSLLAKLPSHTRGLLKITVPVTVTLAAQRKPIQEILELGPGSIVKFDKTCNEPLELAVGERVIATGEVVKVGDKFGLRVAAAR